MWSVAIMYHRAVLVRNPPYPSFKGMPSVALKVEPSWNADGKGFIPLALSQATKREAPGIPEASLIWAKCK